MGSEIAQAPTFSRVSSGSAQRSFCSMVPLLMMAPPVSPMDTPMAVTSPWAWRLSSMIGIMVIAAWSPAPSEGPSFFLVGASSPFSAAAFSRAICFS